MRYEAVSERTVPWLVRLGNASLIGSVAVLLLPWLAGGFSGGYRPSALHMIVFLACSAPFLASMVIGVIGARGPLARFYLPRASYVVEGEGITITNDVVEVIRLPWATIRGYVELLGERPPTGAILGPEKQVLAHVPILVRGPNGNKVESDIVLGEALSKVAPDRLGPHAHLSATGGNTIGG